METKSRQPSLGQTERENETGFLFCHLVYNIYKNTKHFYRESTDCNDTSSVCSDPNSSINKKKCKKNPVLRIRDVFPDSGSRFRLFSIPDPNFFHPGSGSRISIKNLSILTEKNGF
jgi:hypothetical protein